MASSTECVGCAQVWHAVACVQSTVGHSCPSRTITSPNSPFYSMLLARFITHKLSPQYQLRPTCTTLICSWYAISRLAHSTPAGSAALHPARACMSPFHPLTDTIESSTPSPCAFHASTPPRLGHGFEGDHAATSHTACTSCGPVFCRALAAVGAWCRRRGHHKTMPYKRNSTTMTNQREAIPITAQLKHPPTLDWTWHIGGRRHLAAACAVVVASSGTTGSNHQTR